MTNPPGIEYLAGLRILFDTSLRAIAVYPGDFPGRNNPALILSCTCKYVFQMQLLVLMGIDKIACTILEDAVNLANPFRYLRRNESWRN